MAKPIVSVVMGTYNHAPFVAEAIQSVLEQDFSDFEFLIADDGSQDGTAHAVSAIKDTRIDFQVHKLNRGAATVFNELINRARGTYVAIINSDDAWLSGKLSEQVEILEKHRNVAAVFGRASFFDRKSAPIEKAALSFGRVFDQPNRTRGKWLRHFFWRGNCLCHPSAMIRKDVYRQVGLYDNRLRQLPDLDMWVRIVKIGDLHVSRREMVRYRVVPGENASSDTDANRTRTLNEHYYIAMGFFDEVGADLLIDGFGDCLKQNVLRDKVIVDIEKAFLFLGPALALNHTYKLIALTKLRDLLASNEHRQVLKTEYGFDDLAWQRLAAEVDVFRGVQISHVPTRELSLILQHRLKARLWRALRR